MEKIAIIIGIVFHGFCLSGVHGSGRMIHKHCCDIGRRWFVHNAQACTAHPMTENARDVYSPCFLSIEICCTGELRKWNCEAGTKLALDGIPNNHLSDDARECYNCCRLGMRMRKDDRSCHKLPRLRSISSQCRRTYSQCCDQETNGGPVNSTRLKRILDDSKAEHHDHRRKFHFGEKDGASTRGAILHGTTAHVTTESHDLIKGENNCFTGFYFNVDSQQCEDVDECESKPHTCSPEHVCVNMPGSYNCVARDDRVIRHESRRQRHHHQDRHAGDESENYHQINNHNHGTMEYSGEHRTTHVEFKSDSETESKIKTTRGANDIKYYEDISNSIEEESVLIEYQSTTLAAEHTTNHEDSHSLVENKTRTSGGDLEDDIPSSSPCKVGLEYNEETGECEDIDECSEHACQHANMRCRNTWGSYVCYCHSGFIFNPREWACKDIDECTGGNHSCLPDEKCHNTNGSYVCLTAQGDCHRGYYLDKASFQCIDVDECASDQHNCTENQSCSNIPGSFRCLCSDGSIPDDDNNCIIEPSHCNGDDRRCGENRVCKEIDGIFSCHDRVSCEHGFGLNADGSHCQDVNECSTGSHNCTNRHMHCINEVGHFSCGCKQGYEYEGYSHTCEDVDECELGFPCPSNAKCENTPGSFLCVCSLGYQITDDYRGCQDIDECSSGIHACEHECVNTLGSYFCACPQGFKLNYDGFTCSDVDECAENGACLGDDVMCVNTWGSHYCHPTACPSGFARSQKNLEADENGSVICNRLPCQPGDKHCHDNLTSSIQWYQVRLLPHSASAHSPVISISNYGDEYTPVSNFQIVDGNTDDTFELKNVLNGPGGKGIIYVLKELKGFEKYNLKILIDNLNREGKLIAEHIINLIINVSPYSFT